MQPGDRPSGVYPILYAFFDENGAIDEAAMTAECDACIAAGAHGIALLGNVTEVGKLDLHERRRLVEVVGEAIGGRVPFAVTIAEPSVAGQHAFARAAKEAGAGWVIIQPPQIKGIPPKSVVRFLGDVADGCELPVAVQNNPVNLDVALSNDALLTLFRNHENITIFKNDGSAHAAAEIIEATGGRVAVFAGQGGIEFITQLRLGYEGLIPAPDCLAHQVRLFEQWQRGTPEDRAEAERIHRQVLPLIVFLTRNINANQLALGKRRVARHLNLIAHDRHPCVAPSEFGLAEVERLGTGLDPFIPQPGTN